MDVFLRKPVGVKQIRDMLYDMDARDVSLTREKLPPVGSIHRDELFKYNYSLLDMHPSATDPALTRASEDELKKKRQWFMRYCALALFIILCFIMGWMLGHLTRQYRSY